MECPGGRQLNSCFHLAHVSASFRNTRRVCARTPQKLDESDVTCVYLHLCIATRVLAASSSRHPRTHVACCENVPTRVRRGKTRVGVPPPIILCTHT